MPQHTQPEPRATRVSRRNLLLGAGALALCGVGGAGAMAVIGPRIDGFVTDTSVTPQPMDSPLRIPEVVTAGGGVVELTVRAGRTAFVGGREAATKGVNGSYLGPTLRVRRGEEVMIDVRNDLDEPTTMHWHGMHVPPEMDGTPHQSIAPGATWHARWRCTNASGTLWYHPHPHGRTAQQVWEGIAGMIIVDDPEDLDHRLPSEYGIDDIPVVIQDRGFDDDGELATSGAGALGMFGDTILVNGTPGARFDVTRERTRLRILNGSNTRWYHLALSDGRAMQVVATDGGRLYGGPATVRTLLVSPGERYEVVVTVRAGEDITLRSVTSDYPGGKDYGTGEEFDVLRLVAKGSLSASPPPAFPPASSPPETPGVPVRRIRLDGHSAINGEEMDMSRIDSVHAAGGVEVWEVSSLGTAAHNFHIHGVSFRVLSVGDGDPDAVDRGPKDTVKVPKDGSVVRLLVTMPEHSSETVPYMAHCHVLQHEDMGMMMQFTVVEPGQEASAPRTLSMQGAGHAKH